ncbi:MAG: hypothetical protein DWQ02_21820, partial [Bacteroidetes bacterium]
MDMYYTSNFSFSSAGQRFQKTWLCKALLVLAVLGLPIMATSQTYNMQNGTVNTCSGTLYDSGGPGGTYQNNELLTFTICPDNPGDLTQVTFTSFSLEPSFDYLYFWDGPNTSSTYLGSYTGSNSPGTMTSTDPSGCLTIQFISDGSVRYSGWTANISCVPGSIDILMQDGFINTCSATFYDSGGSNSNYQNNESYTLTICPDNSGDFIEVNFTYFNLESCCDFLRIFDGSSTGDPVIGTYYSTGPGMVTSTHPSGCLTFFFDSDFSITDPGWVADISCVSNDIIMQNGTVNTCSGTFYDSGGSNSYYQNNEQYTFTICPDNPGDFIEVNFTSFDLESCCDFLEIYDGSSTGDPLIGTYYGSSPGTVTSTHSSGCLTFFFDSDFSITDSGWAADVSCVNNDILMQNGTINTCSGTFYDSGGPNGDYQNYDYYTLTICPDNSGGFIQADFIAFDLESCCDFLRIHDGSSIGDPVIGVYYGSSPGTVTSTHSSGCLTFFFDADFSITDPGWEADISCFQNTAPNAVCQNLTRDADVNCQAVVNPSEFDGGSSDPEGQTLTYSVSPMGPYPLGTTNVSLTVTDPFGLSSTCNASITVEDNTPPTINNCPATNIVV